MGDAMRTNTWDDATVIIGTGLICAGVCTVAGFPNPLCVVPCTLATEEPVRNSLVKAGSLPGDVEPAMFDRMPAGYVSCPGEHLDLEEVHRSLSHGNPIMYLESRGEANLHWAVITGLYYPEGSNELHVRIANAGNSSWDRFQENALLGKVGSDVVETVLDEFFGVEETSIYWAKFEHTSPGSLPGFPRVCDQ
jgi:hypothetical protein